MAIDQFFIFFGMSLGMYLFTTAVYGAQLTWDVFGIKKPNYLSKVAGTAMLMDAVSTLFIMLAYYYEVAGEVWFRVLSNVWDALMWLVLLCIGEVLMRGRIAKRMVKIGIAMLAIGLVFFHVFGEKVLDALVIFVCIVLTSMFLIQVYGILRHDRKLADMYSDIERRKGTWYIWISLPFLLEMVAWYVHQKDLTNYKFLMHYNLYMVVFWTFVARFVCNQEPLEPSVEAAEESNEPVIAMSKEKLKSLKDGLETLMYEQDIYLRHDVNVMMVAKELGTNRTYIGQMLKSEYNQTFHQYINSMRIERAKKLLRVTDEKLLYVAEHSGFSSAETLSRTFRQYVGMTPQEYRRQKEE